MAQYFKLSPTTHLRTELLWNALKCEAQRLSKPIENEYVYNVLVGASQLGYKGICNLVKFDQNY